MNCEYGCGQEAHFILSNGKHCCSDHYNKCPAIRKRNSMGVKKAHENNHYPNLNSPQNKKVLIKASLLNKKRLAEKAKLEFRKDNPLSSKVLRYNLTETFGFEKKCACCGLSEWMGKPIPLEVHHKDGDSSNNEISNLEFLCLNCHALTDTFRGKGINGPKKVSDDELLRALKESDSIRQALIKVGLSPRGGNYSRAYTLLNKKLE